MSLKLYLSRQELWCFSSLHSCKVWLFELHWTSCCTLALLPQELLLKSTCNMFASTITADLFAHTIYEKYSFYWSSLSLPSVWVCRHFDCFNKASNAWFCSILSFWPWSVNAQWAYAFDTKHFVADLPHNSLFLALFVVRFWITGYICLKNK